ncbi:MAG: SCO family protein [Rhodospirillales bacterium]|nr:SCO family protein [Acetobacter sp.]
MPVSQTAARELPAAAPVNRTLQWVVWSALGLIILALGVGVVRQQWRAAERHGGGSELGHYNRVPEFALTERSGQPFDSASLKGKVWLASFFFTACPGPCLRMNSRLQEVQQALNKDRQGDVQIVSFSIAPEMDTPEVLRKYAERFHASPDHWSFLTGDRDKIYDLAHQVFTFAVKKVDDPDDPNAYVHSTRVALVDRDGVVRGSFDTTNPDGTPNEEVVQQILTSVGELLREPPAGK